MIGAMPDIAHEVHAQDGDREREPGLRSERVDAIEQTHSAHFCPNRHRACTTRANDSENHGVECPGHGIDAPTTRASAIPAFGATIDCRTRMGTERLQAEG